MAGEIKVEDLLGQIGQAIFTAQQRLNKQSQETPPGPTGLPTTLSIAETDLEVKMLFEEKQAGAVIRPVSLANAQTPSGSLSTLKAKIVAVPDEDVRPPQRSPIDVKNQVAAQPDVVRLTRIFGELTVTPVYVPDAQRWVVDVAEPGGNVLRSVQVADVKDRNEVPR